MGHISKAAARHILPFALCSAKLALLFRYGNQTVACVSSAQAATISPTMAPA